jgi:RNA polymerase sigma-70 factor (ECF subfamily)
LQPEALMQTTPVSLLARLARPAAVQDTAADWERFVELFTPLLYHWTGRLGMQPHDAADLVQDVFVTLVRKLPEFQYDERRSFRSWLRTLLMNQWRDRCRRARAAAAADRASVVDPADPNLAEDVEAAEYRRQLARQALSLMRRDFQEATWRACWETKACGRPAPEVAAELGMSVASVHSATYRVLRRLRQELDGLLE